MNEYLITSNIKRHLMKTFKIMAFSLIVVGFSSCNKVNETQNLIEDLKKSEMIIEKLQTELDVLQKRHESMMIKCETLLTECKNEN